MYVKPEKSTMYLLLGLGLQLLNSIRAGMFHELLHGLMLMKFHLRKGY